MKKNYSPLRLCLLILFTLGPLQVFSQSANKYLGQVPPGNTIRRFPPDNRQMLAVNGIWSWHGAPSFSPDCKEMFFVKYLHAIDRPEIWHTRLVNNQWTVPVLASFGNQAVIENCPVFSSTGDTLFFYSERSGSGGFYHTIRQSGESWPEPQKLLLTLPSGLATGWNLSISRNRTLYFDLYQASSGSDIYRSEWIDGSYSTPVRLPDQVNSPSGEGCAFIDPDEEYLLFISNRTGGFGLHDIYISYRTRDGGWSQSVNLGNWINTATEEGFPMVSPDGKYLFFNTVRASSQDQGYNAYWVSAAFIDLMRPIEPDTSGRVVFFSDRDGNAEIYSMFPDGSDLKRLTSNLSTDIDPAWSGDGNQVVFASDREGNQELYLMSADGSNQRKLTVTGLVAGTPDWSPDGTRIVFTVFEDNFSEEGNIGMIGPDGSGYEIFQGAGQGCGPTWTGDGSSIVFTSRRTGFSQIYLMDSDGGNVQQISRDQSDKLSPRVSPDGQKILYTLVSPDRKDSEIHLMNADGTGDIQLTRTGNLSKNPGWSTDGKQIVFQSNRFGNHEIYQMGTNGKNQVNITRNTGNDYSPSISRKPVSTGVPYQVDDPDRNAFAGLWPNPAGSQTLLKITLAHSGRVGITVVDQLGKPVKELPYENLPAGNHLVKIDLTNLPSGIYTVILTAGTERLANKLIKK